MESVETRGRNMSLDFAAFYKDLGSDVTLVPIERLISALKKLVAEKKPDGVNGDGTLRAKRTIVSYMLPTATQGLADTVDISLFATCLVQRALLVCASVQAHCRDPKHG